MTTTQLNALLEKHGLKINGWHEGAGKFRDLEIGVGAPLETLQALRHDICQHKLYTPRLASVNNVKHPDYGKLYLEIPSFWWSEDNQTP